mmetsp:Transcript_3764/g.9125  ORF Transcript_3764/g.9125 Transcript_3764/m.9125 type:complete len:294 (-) Transcript_3764:3169-4050(-)
MRSIWSSSFKTGNSARWGYANFTLSNATPSSSAFLSPVLAVEEVVTTSPPPRPRPKSVLSRRFPSSVLSTRGTRSTSANMSCAAASARAVLGPVAAACPAAMPAKKMHITALNMSVGLSPSFTSSAPYQKHTMKISPITPLLKPNAMPVHIAFLLSFFEIAKTMASNFFKKSVSQVSAFTVLIASTASAITLPDATTSGESVVTSSIEPTRATIISTIDAIRSGSAASTTSASFHDATNAKVRPNAIDDSISHFDPRLSPARNPRSADCFSSSAVSRPGACSGSSKKLMSCSR